MYVSCITIDFNFEKNSIHIVHNGTSRVTLSFTQIRYNDDEYICGSEIILKAIQIHAHRCNMLESPSDKSQEKKKNLLCIYTNLFTYNPFQLQI